MFVCALYTIIQHRMVGRTVNGPAGNAGGSFLDRMKHRNKRVVVFYGSQTGTGEEFATRLAKDANRLGLPAITVDPEDVTDWVRVCGQE